VDGTVYTSGIRAKYDQLYDHIIVKCELYCTRSYNTA
jgi:hypothetical protein